MALFWKSALVVSILSVCLLPAQAQQFDPDFSLSKPPEKLKEIIPREEWAPLFAEEIPSEPISLEEQYELMAAKRAYREEFRDPEWRGKRPAIGWIDTPYHGEIFDGNLEAIEMDYKTVVMMQDSLFSMLEEGALGELRAQYEDNGYKELDQLVYRQALLKQMLDKAEAEMRSEYEWRLALLNPPIFEFVSAELIEIDDDVYNIYSEIWNFSQPGAKYLKDCKAKGVPIPPTFPSKSWTNQGELGYTFIARRKTAEVYTYKDSSSATPGTCIALPRSYDGSTKFSDGGRASLIGVICQGATQVGGKQHACFWDSRERKADGTTGGKIDGVSKKMVFGYTMDGYSLNENCSSCHRGNNAFNIHPGTALDLNRANVVGGPFQTYASWYSPIGSAKFQNPPKTVLAPPLTGQRSCQSCHDIGATSTGYCSVIADAAHWTMPPKSGRDTSINEGPAGWPTSAQPHFYRQHVTKLRQLCPTARVDVFRK